VRPIDQRNFVLLWLQTSGDTTQEIADKTGLALRTVQEGLQRAKDLQEHLEQKGLDFSDPDWIRVLLAGVGYCVHGLPTTIAGTWVCAMCTKSNNEKHRAFRRGNPIKDKSKGEQAQKDLAKELSAAELQPKGRPKFRPRIKAK
jgi:hypothetical protein